ncbi:MAG TPA: hypothetical protein VET86_12650 [Casimicrobiaceae bacterium]|nr:hypothetical protein [Casimicrobiaceae bacterium]
MQHARTAWRRSTKLRVSGLAVAAALTIGACAAPSQSDGFNAFLLKIAADCKPLVIGSDDMGQAIVFNGQGATRENYNNFLGKTSALYAGGISQQVYRDSMTAFVGGGSYNQRSFDCIVAHLPAAPAR